MQVHILIIISMKYMDFKYIYIYNAYFNNNKHKYKLF